MSGFSPFLDIWQLDLAGADAAVERWLDPAEAERLRRRNGAGFGICRAALRLILAEYLGRDPRELRFMEEGRGRPRLAGGELSFSVSRSAERGLIAVGPPGALGVDIERVRPLPEMAAIAAMFHALERRSLEAAEPKDRLAGFYRCWTRKEAALKAVGVGLSLGLDILAVGDERAGAGPSLLLAAGLPEARRLGIVDLELDGPFASAVAAGKPMPPIRLLRWRGDACRGIAHAA